MLNKLSYNLANSLNESNDIKIKKEILIESTGVSENNIEEAHMKKESRKTIWTTEVDTSEESYKEYLDSMGYEDGDEDIPSYESWVEGQYDSDYDYIIEDLDENILPMIETQLNHDMIFLSGNYNSNYGDFRPSGGGGVSLKGTDELKQYISRWDVVELSEEDGNLVLDAGDHDGSIEVALFTFIDNKDKILEDLGYYEEERKYAEENDPEFDWKLEAESSFEKDLYYGGIDWDTVKDHLDLLIPIKVNL